MPQMAPLSWLSLFIMFSVTLILFSTTAYFLITRYPPDTQMNKISTIPLNWKW
uniref:ATP synthase complex subunit 8 n=1 Tax=Tarragoilus diuturnus TaxID=1258561 RepID=M9P211_9ORTH|nr:ATP synthase F0 subunit 8 [Tarragoilus diuturnus]AFW98784.1 ATP synthase F0 subunit 8 [Tarragoilus diuturnus]